MDSQPLKIQVDSKQAQADLVALAHALDQAGSATVNFGTKFGTGMSQVDRAAKGSMDTLDKFARVAQKVGQIKISNDPGAHLKQFAASLTSLSSANSSIKGSMDAINKVVQLTGLLNKVKISSDVSAQIRELAGSINSLSRVKAPSAGSLKGFVDFVEIASRVQKLKFDGGSIGALKDFAGAMNFIAKAKAPSDAKLKNFVNFIEIAARAQQLKFNGGTAQSLRIFASSMDAIGKAKVPTAARIANLRELFAILPTLKAPSGAQKLSSLFATIATLRAPSAKTTERLKMLFDTLGQAKSIPGAGKIAHDLDTVAAAASRASAALSGMPKGARGIGPAFAGVTRGPKALNEEFSKTPAHVAKAHAAYGTAGKGLHDLTGRFNLAYQASTVFSAFFSAFTVGQFLHGIYDSSIALLKLQKALFFATGTLTGANKATDDYIHMSNELGLSIDKNIESYSKFTISARASGMSLKSSNEIYTALGGALQVVGASSEQTGLAFLGLTQMIGKGKVSAEEFNRQIGEQLPGNAVIGARALSKLRGEHVSVAQFFKEMSLGKILSGDFVPAYAAEIQKEFGELNKLARIRPDVALNRLQNAFFQFKGEIGKGGFTGALTNEFNKLYDSIIYTENGVDKLTPAAQHMADVIGKNLTKVVHGVGDGLTWLVNHIDQVVMAIKGLLALKVADTFATWGGSAVLMAAQFSGIGGMKPKALGEGGEGIMGVVGSMMSYKANKKQQSAKAADAAEDVADIADVVTGGGKRGRKKRGIVGNAIRYGMFGPVTVPMDIAKAASAKRRAAEKAYEALGDLGDIGFRSGPDLEGRMGSSQTTRNLINRRAAGAIRTRTSGPSLLARASEFFNPSRRVDTGASSRLNLTPANPSDWKRVGKWAEPAAAASSTFGKGYGVGLKGVAKDIDGIEKAATKATKGTSGGGLMGFLGNLVGIGGAGKKAATGVVAAESGVAKAASGFGKFAGILGKVGPLLGLGVVGAVAAAGVALAIYGDTTTKVGGKSVKFNDIVAGGFSVMGKGIADWWDKSKDHFKLFTGALDWVGKNAGEIVTTIVGAFVTMGKVIGDVLGGIFEMTKQLIVNSPLVTLVRMLAKVASGDWKGAMEVGGDALKSGFGTFTAFKAGANTIGKVAEDIGGAGNDRKAVAAAAVKSAADNAAPALADAATQQKWAEAQAIEQAKEQSRLQEQQDGMIADMNRGANLKDGLRTLDQIATDAANLQKYGVDAKGNILTANTTATQNAADAAKAANSAAGAATDAARTAISLIQTQASTSTGKLKDNVGSGGNAFDLAATMVGKTEQTDAGSINAFLRKGGVDLNAATTAWCAAFVNSALAQVGVKGDGSMKASDFRKWGAGVTPMDAKKGDVVVDISNQKADGTGAHVGMATGQTRKGTRGQNQVQILSGNYGDKVGYGWVNEKNAVVRRATEGSNAIDAKMQDAAVAGVAADTKPMSEADQAAFMKNRQDFSEKVDSTFRRYTNPADSAQHAYDLAVANIGELQQQDAGAVAQHPGLKPMISEADVLSAKKQLEKILYEAQHPFEVANKEMEQSNDILAMRAKGLGDEADLQERFNAMLKEGYTDTNKYTAADLAAYKAGKARGDLLQSQIDLQSELNDVTVAGIVRNQGPVAGDIASHIKVKPGQDFNQAVADAKANKGADGVSEYDNYAKGALAREGQRKSNAVEDLNTNLGEMQATAGLSSTAKAYRDDYKGYLEELTGISGKSLDFLEKQDPALTAMAKHAADIKQKLENPPGFQKWIEGLEPLSKRLEDIKTGFAESLSDGITDALVGDKVDWAAKAKDLQKQVVKAQVDEGLKGIMKWMGVGGKDGDIEKAKTPEGRAIVAASETTKAAATDMTGAAANLDNSALGLNTVVTNFSTAVSAFSSAITAMSGGTGVAGSGLSSVGGTMSSLASAATDGGPITPLSLGTMSSPSIDTSLPTNFPSLLDSGPQMATVGQNDPDPVITVTGKRPTLSPVDMPTLGTMAPDRVLDKADPIMPTLMGAGASAGGGGLFGGIQSLMGKHPIASSLGLSALLGALGHKKKKITDIEHPVNGVIGQAGQTTMSGKAIDGHANVIGSLLSTAVGMAGANGFGAPGGNLTNALGLGNAAGNALGKGAMSAASGAGTNGLKGWFSRAFGGTGTTAKSGMGGLFSKLFGGFFEEGGIATSPVSRMAMPASTWADAPHYKEGTPNTSGGMPAILHPDEAVIPLSKGRSIPVEMNGAGGGGATHYNTNITVVTPDANSFRKAGSSIQREQGKQQRKSNARNLNG